MSIHKTPLWAELKKFVVIQIYGRDGHPNPRFRINFRPMPQDLLVKALALTIPCAACGDPVHPVRIGKGFGLYYAGSCPLTKNIACSRSGKVSAEYIAIKAEVDCLAAEPDASQLDLWEDS